MAEPLEAATLSVNERLEVENRAMFQALHGGGEEGGISACQKLWLAICLC